MRKTIISLIISMVITLNMCLIFDVKAFEENAFTGGECITDESWMSSATTEYKLNNETGVYELSGQTYTAYKAANSGNLYVFYSISTDGRILYGYVPNYATVIANQTSRDAINNKGVFTTSSCANTLKVSKTVIGNPPTSDSGANQQGSNISGSTGGELDANENGSQNTSNTEELESPNTASTTAKIAIVASIALVAVAAYSIILKTKPELFKKNK